MTPDGPGSDPRSVAVRSAGPGAVPDACRIRPDLTILKEGLRRRVVVRDCKRPASRDGRASVADDQRSRRPSSFNRPRRPGDQRSSGDRRSTSGFVGRKEVEGTEFRRFGILTETILAGLSASPYIKGLN